MNDLCAACNTEQNTPDLIAVAGPHGANWYCRDATACRERRKKRRAGGDDQ